MDSFYEESIFWSLYIAESEHEDSLNSSSTVYHYIYSHEKQKRRCFCRFLFLLQQISCQSLSSFVFQNIYICMLIWCTVIVYDQMCVVQKAKRLRFFTIAMVWRRKKMFEGETYIISKLVQHESSSTRVTADGPENL